MDDNNSKVQITMLGIVRIIQFFIDFAFFSPQKIAWSLEQFQSQHFRCTRTCIWNRKLLYFYCDICIKNLKPEFIKRYFNKNQILHLNEYWNTNIYYESSTGSDCSRLRLYFSRGTKNLISNNNSFLFESCTFQLFYSMPTCLLLSNWKTHNSTVISHQRKMQQFANLIFK